MNGNLYNLSQMARSFNQRKPPPIVIAGWGMGGDGVRGGSIGGE